MQRWARDWAGGAGKAVGGVLTYHTSFAEGRFTSGGCTQPPVVHQLSSAAPTSSPQVQIGDILAGNPRCDIVIKATCNKSNNNKTAPSPSPQVQVGDFGRPVFVHKDIGGLEAGVHHGWAGSVQEQHACKQAE